MAKPFRLKAETATDVQQLHQTDLFPQWYEYYIVQETDEPIPPVPQRVLKPITAWWLKGNYA